MRLLEQRRTVAVADEREQRIRVLALHLDAGLRSFAISGPGRPTYAGRSFFLDWKIV